MRELFEVAELGGTLCIYMYVVTMIKFWLKSMIEICPLI
jgi:hypothetical protein